MARKKKHPEHVNHERWLVSWADFMTLLFALFVVLFSVSKVDTNQVGRFTESFASAVGIPLGGGAYGRGIMPGALVPTAADKGVGDKGKGGDGEIDEVESKLRKKGGAADAMEGVTILRVGNELVLRFAEAATFASGDAQLKEPAVRALLAVAEVLRDRAVLVRVEGHTDNVPISNARYRSNWELSTARATAVVVELASRGRFDPRRLAAAGYGEFHPIGPNDTPEHRGLNRRVDIVITALHDRSPEPAASATPSATSSASAAATPSTSPSASAATTPSATPSASAAPAAAHHPHP
jgi:chemotaxis protein MotB